MKKTILALSCVLLLNLSGNEELPDILQKDFKVTIDWLDEKPKSYSKDFYIIQFLKQENITIEDAKKAYDMANSSNSIVRSLYNKKFRTIPEEEMKCYRASIDELLKENSKCIALGLSLKEATKLPKDKLALFIPKLDAYPTLRDDLKIILSEKPFEELKNSDINKFFRLFFALGSSYRMEKFNEPLSAEFINKIALDKNFYKFIRYTIFDKEYKNLQESLLLVNDNKDLITDALFLLGLNAVNHDKIDIAYNFFYNAYKKAYLKNEKDKALFWIYLITDNKSFLYELSKSWDNNIYALYAKELLEVDIDNIVYNLDMPNTKSSFNIYDQFEWMNVLSDTKKNFDEEKLKKYQALFTDDSTLPHYAYILERYNKYRTQYYITPYKDLVKDYSTYKQVLIYSIAKQESRFIPSSISVSTAQGVMQIMPFLSEDIAKKLNEDYNIFEQFVPKTNIRFGSFHLDSLMRQFDNNPLFIAYAYNGGAGYTKSQFRKGLFKRKAKYEPFLSMEMMSYPETRNYGKKVLANYYVYNNYLNTENKIRLTTIFQTLVAPN